MKMKIILAGIRLLLRSFSPKFSSHVRAIGSFLSRWFSENQVNSRKFQIFSFLFQRGDFFSTQQCFKFFLVRRLENFLVFNNISM